MRENTTDKNPTFYGSQQEASKKIDAILVAVKESNLEYVDINHLVLQITNEFAVSQSMVRKRIDLWLETYKMEFGVVDGSIVKKEAADVSEQEDTD